jgi:hypothetical protein
MPHPETSYSHGPDAQAITVYQYQAKKGFGKHVIKKMFTAEFKADVQIIPPPPPVSKTNQIMNQLCSMQDSLGLSV